jgi:hypothetical protein
MTPDTLLGPVTNDEWNQFKTHLFPNGATCIHREGVNALLESRKVDPRVEELQSLLSNLGDPVDADKVGSYRDSSNHGDIQQAGEWYERNAILAIIEARIKELQR